MKNIIRLILLIISSSVYSQELVHDVHFTFENSQITDNGENYFFEVDIMIQTINSTGSFKLGSGQLYFNYNTDAFGTNIMENSRVEFSYPEDSGYLCAQGIDAVAGAKIYGSFTINDNTTSRVSWAFSQNFSASTFAMDNVTEIPTKLCHLKIQFIDSEQSPLLTYESGTVYDDQFYTACGPINGNPFQTADCGAEAGTQLLNDSFDSSGSTLISDTTAPVITLLGDNPVTIEVGSTYTDAGATALDNYDGDISSNIIVTGSVDTNTLGTYTITYSLTDSSGNTAITVIRTVYVEDGLSLSNMEIMELKIFPNPTSSIWQIKSSRIIESIALFNLIGKRLMYKETFSDHIQIDATSFPDGIYLILINKNNMVRLIKH